MQIIIAECSVIYTGRGNTTLPKAVRAILIKADGSVSIHADTNGNKPLNYMGAGNKHTVNKKGKTHYWIFENKKESIHITIYKILSNTEYELEGSEPGLARTGTEKHLQAWLADNVEIFGENTKFIGREYPTGAGAVDLLIQKADGTYVSVEVKRVAILNAVDQATRYVEALNASGEHGKVEGMIAALEIKPNTLKLAESRGIKCLQIPLDWDVK